MQPRMYIDPDKLLFGETDGKQCLLKSFDGDIWHGCICRKPLIALGCDMCIVQAIIDTHNRKRGWHCQGSLVKISEPGDGHVHEQLEGFMVRYIDLRLGRMFLALID
jgi:hypothetical protein